MAEPSHVNPSPNDDEEQQSSKGPQRSEIVRAVMYGGALSAGVFLVLFGKTTAVEASGYVSPFLVIFEGSNRGI
ncbi:hypothetical protein [Streptomyces mirabilis]|uniref:Uncharacterized protein n=1 Tax=Streptomyces mirabilis TaxID=68239 RepID=A0ABU3UP91_9ACTN|nr:MULTISPECIES: hypothetical protein [Streptomyces]MDU8995721.1 hypothetical protein [Streptomyces mirabilis]QIY73429.1 hypothetical protein HEP84_34100 [Streptomyces sp. RLB1-33]